MQPVRSLCFAYLTLGGALAACSAPAKPIAASPEVQPATVTEAGAPPAAEVNDGGARVGAEDAGATTATDELASPPTEASPLNLEPATLAWKQTCTAALEKAKADVHAAGADADATPRILSQASADGTVVVMLAYASDRNKYGWLEASSTLWNHRVEQTKGWDGTTFPAPLNLVRNEGRAGGTLLAFKEVPPQARKDFERIARAAVDRCIAAQPRAPRPRR